MILAYILFGATLAFLTLSRVRREPFFSPVKMFLYGGAVVEGAYASGFVVYENKLSILTVVIVISSKLLFLVGALVVGRSEETHRSRKRLRLKIDHFDRIVLLIFGIGAAGAGILSGLQLIRIGGLDVSFFSGGLSHVRSEMWDDLYSGASAVTPIRSLMTVSTFCLAVLLPYFWAQRRIFLVILAAYSCVVIVADSITVGGRFSIALLAMSLVVSSAAALDKNRLSEFVNVRAALLIGGTAFYVLIVFPVQRNPELPYAVNAYLGWIAEAEIADWVYNVAKLPGLDWFTVLAYSTSYFSGALDKLNYFVTSTDVGEWYMLGLYNFPVISQVSAALGLGDYYWLEIRSMIASEMEYIGLAGNPWSTGVRDFSIDFGFFGSIGAFGLMGAGCQFAYIRGARSSGIYWKVLSIVSVVGAFIIAFVSPFQIRLLANSLFLVLIFLLFKGLVSASRGSKSAVV